MVSGYQGGVTGLTCGGDSGSPLVIFDSQKEQHLLVGVVSGGTCQSYDNPSIFARVEDHEILEFIMKQTWDNIPPTGRKAIEKLMLEIQDVKNENGELENKIKQNEVELTELKSMLVKIAKKVNDDVSSKFISLSATTTDLWFNVAKLSEPSKVFI